MSGSVEAFQNAIDKGQKDVLEVIAAAIPESLKACVCKVRAVYVVAVEGRPFCLTCALSPCGCV